MTNTDGVYIEGRRIDTGDCSGPKSARNVLLHPDVDAAVLETARGGVLREGLAFDRCDVAVVTNIGMGDHLGLNYITTVEDLAVVKRVVVQNVAPDGVAVLNAADPMCVQMAMHCPGSVTFFASDRHHPVIATHRAQGHRVVYVDGDCHRGGTRAMPSSACRWRRFRSRATAPSVSRSRMRWRPWPPPGRWNWTGTSSARACAASSATRRPRPGRFNLFDYRGATLIADYGHNPDAILALVQGGGSHAGATPHGRDQRRRRPAR